MRARAGLRAARRNRGSGYVIELEHLIEGVRKVEVIRLVMGQAGAWPSCCPRGWIVAGLYLITLRCPALGTAFESLNPYSVVSSSAFVWSIVERSAIEYPS